MKRTKITLLILILLFAATAIFSYEKRYTSSAKTDTANASDTLDWQILHNVTYGYDVMCPADFDCNYTCGTRNPDEQFCAYNKADTSATLYMSQQPIQAPDSNTLSVSVFNNTRVTVTRSLKYVLYSLRQKMLPLGVTELDNQQFNINGVEEIKGFSKYNASDDATTYTEEWFFVKNDLLYQATIKYSGPKANESAMKQSFFKLRNIFGTTTF